METKPWFNNNIDLIKCRDKLFHKKKQCQEFIQNYAYINKDVMKAVRETRTNIYYKKKFEDSSY